MKAFIFLFIAIISVLWGANACVTFYDSQSLRGNSYSACTQEAQFNSKFDNKVRSLRVPAGWIITVYANPNYSGAKRTFVASQNTLTGVSLDKKISSYKAQQIVCPLIFDQKDYQGNFVEVCEGIFNEMPTGFAAKVSSILLPSGYRAIFYDRTERNGKLVSLTQSKSSLGSNWNAKANSLTIDVPGVNNQGLPCAILYTSKNYAGTPYSVCTSISDFGSAKNTFDSVRISNGGVLKTYSEKDLKSISGSFTQDTPEFVESITSASFSTIIEADQDTSQAADVVQPQECVELFAEKDFQGAKTELCEKFNINIDVKTVGSIIVPAGKFIALFTEDSFQGESFTLSSSVQDTTAMKIPGFGSYNTFSWDCPTFFSADNFAGTSFEKCADFELNGKIVKSWYNPGTLWKIQGVTSDGKADKTYVTSASTLSKTYKSIKVSARRVNEFSWLCTHNSFANAANGFRSQALTQGYSEQLAMGVRSFMVDFYNDGASILMYHSLKGYGTAKVTPFFEDIRKFLEFNKHAFITVFIEDYSSPGKTQIELTSAGLSDYVVEVNSEWDKSDGKTRWPKVRDLIKKNKRVMIYTDVANNQDNKKTFLRRTYVWENYWSIGMFEVDPSCPSRDGGGNYKVTPTVPTYPLFTMNHYRDTANPTRALVDNKYDFMWSRILNNCYPTAGLLPNYISVDHFSIGDALQVVKDVNELLNNGYSK